jgi:atypical dual specificity phosphatase
MAEPYAFSWIEKPHLAAMGRPGSEEELRWLKKHGLEVVVSLTEEPLHRREVDNAGLLLYHVPVPDMTAPTQEELDRCVSAIRKAKELGMGVAVHCGAGAGRTGVVLACYFVHQGMKASEAIRKIRKLRPGSIETKDQEEAVREFARRHTAEGELPPVEDT